MGRQVAATRPEIELLLTCARSRLELTQAEALSALLANDLDWTYLVRTALSHGISPLLAHHVLRISDEVPDDVRRALGEHFDDNRQRALELAAVLFELLDACAARGITAIPFKGPTLAVMAWGDLSLRRAGDLDLLVREDELDGLCRTLAERGFQEITAVETGRALSEVEDAAYRRYQCEYAFVRERDRVVVEPHWAFAPRTMAVPVDYEALWRRARPVPLLERQAPTLAVEDLLLALCIHGSKHEWTQLRWICDVAELVARHPGIDADACLRRAREQGSARMLLLGVGLARLLLDAALPPAVAEALGADRRACALVQQVAHRLFREDVTVRPPSRVTAFRVRMRERLRDRAGYVVRTLATPTVEYMRMLPLPARLQCLYVPLKLGHDWLALPLWVLARRLVSVGWLALHGLQAGTTRRVLIVDWLPHVHEGAGFPRMNALVRLLCNAGYRVTIHPVFPCFESAQRLHADIPPAVEVIRERGLDDLEMFLAQRGRQFGTLIISRPDTMRRLVQILDRRPAIAARARLVYDAEAVFALREIQRARLLGTPVDEVVARRMVDEEVGLAARADAVIVVSASERALFADRGARAVHVLPHAVRPAPTPRGFEDRRGLLFVGRLAEDGWPNTDALSWFRDEVFAEVRRRLGARGECVTLMVAGMMGARAFAGPAPAHIRFLGIVTDLTPLYDEARVFVAPTRFAAGVPLKIYEAAAHGVPVVATRLLVDQLGWRAGEDVLAGEVSDAAAFADNVVALYTCRDLWAQVRANALARVAADASPERALATMRQVLATPRRRP